MSRKKLSPKQLAGKRAKDRGRSFEYRVAKRLNGKRRILSRGGDVDARGFLVECKYRHDAYGIKPLKDMIVQARKYVNSRPMDWVLALTFGGKKNTFILMDIDLFDELTKDRIEEE